jgi:hypothetical protein
MLRTIWRSVEMLLMLLGILAAAVIGLRLQDAALQDVVEPPQGVQTLNDFRKWRPQYDRAFKVEAGGSTYYLVHGERGRVLASGPSGYVFDARGNFVGWIRDTGDDRFIRIVMDERGRSALPLERIAAEKDRS